MKKMYKLFSLLCVFAVTFTACSDDDDDKVIQPVNYEVTVKFDKKAKEKKAENVSLTLTSTTSGKKYTVKTNAEGVGRFDQIVPDTYNLSASLELTRAGLVKLLGYDFGQEKSTFSASAENLTINSTSTLKNELTLLTAKVGDLLFKQINYGGSDFRKGAGFRDMFFEIYNNSNETIYADGLYFAQIYSRTKTSVEQYTLKNGQFDWSKSIGQKKGDKSNTDYSYADHIYQIPGDGKTYPIKPGKSIVVAATALNHKSPLVVGDKKYSVLDPSLTIDLSNATFEVNLAKYLLSIGKKPYDTDVDNPDVPNVKIAYNLVNREFIMDPLGRDAYVIFRTNDFASFGI